MPSRPHQLARVRARALLAVACVLACGLATQGAGQAATGSVTVSATVPSATSLDVTGCSGSDLAVGPLTTLSTSISATPCDVTFGSSNNTAALRVFQADGSGSALTQLAATPTMRTGGIDWEGLSAKDDNEAWVVGDPRMSSDPVPIAHTTDGGATWVAQTSCHATAPLQDVAYVTASTVVAVGGASVICRSVDGGATWTRVTSPTTSTWNGIDMRPDGLGWIVGSGGKSARTTDGGATWTGLPDSDPTWYMQEVEAASSTQLYAAAYTATSPRNALALSSSDGGLTWAAVTVATTQTAWAYGIAVTGVTSAVLGSSSGTFRTTDSGATWTQVDGFSGLCVTASASGVILAFNTYSTPPRRSTDGGATWSPTTLPTTASGQIWACDSSSATTTWYAGFNDQRARSTDAGLSWTQASTTFQDLRAVIGWTTDAWAAVGHNGAVRQTNDGGSSVTQRPSGTTEHLLDAVATSSISGVAVGDLGVILRTTDRGATWVAANSGTTAQILGVDVSPDGRLYAVAGPAVLTSGDGGVTWTTTASAPGGTPTAVAAAPGGVVVVGTSTGAILRSSDAGATWTPQTSGTTLRIDDIDTIDGAVVVAVTNVDGMLNSRVLRTSDGGSAWNVETTSGHGYGVDFVDTNTVFIATSFGYRRSSDGGITWTNVGGITNAYGLATLDAHTAVLAAQGDVLATIRPARSFGDYVSGSIDFSGTASTFGACLQTASGTASTLWPVAGLGNCTATNLTNWRGIAADATGGTARVATTSTSGTGTLAFRFGAKPGTTQRSGDYAAHLVWEVVAPS